MNAILAYGHSAHGSLGSLLGHAVVWQVVARVVRHVPFPVVLAAAAVIGLFWLAGRRRPGRGRRG